MAPPGPTIKRRPPKSSTSSISGTCLTAVSYLILALAAFHWGFVAGSSYGCDAATNPQLLQQQQGLRRQQEEQENDYSMTEKYDQECPKCNCNDADQPTEHKDIRKLEQQNDSSMKTAEKTYWTLARDEANRQNQLQNQNSDFADSIGRLFIGAARVSRDDFIQEFDLGVPWDKTDKRMEDVLLMYSDSKAMPTAKPNLVESNSWPPKHFSSAKDATEHCEIMKVVLQKPGERNHCLAIIPQWESYQVYKYMRWFQDDRKNDKTSMDHPLVQVSRHNLANGKGPTYPVRHQTKRYLPMLANYILTYEDTMNRLEPVAKEVARKSKSNAIVVMVCNFGQSELFLNFVCSAKARNLDLSQILLFATDDDMFKLASAMGDVAVFDVQDAFGDKVPKDAAKAYGDRNFQGMMMSKLYCVHLINAMGYDLLFQDVDVVWYQNPLEYFASEESGDFDFYFQDDGAHSNRYLPYSPNSGFYYVRNNLRTQTFFSYFVRLGDEILAASSHQSVMNDILSDHASSKGLKVKVLGRDSEIGRKFPGGFHYHQRKSFMKDLFSKTIKPYIFHMSWTKNKDNKQKFYQQMGDWFLNDQCISKPLSQISGADKDFAGTCCSAEPLVKCHYRDKPSKNNCKLSPPIDAGGKSFW